MIFNKDNTALSQLIAWEVRGRQLYTNRPWGQPAGLQGRLTEPPKVSKEQHVLVDVGRDGRQTCSWVSLWGLVDLRLTCLCIPTRLGAQLVDPPKSPRPDSQHEVEAAHKAMWRWS